jgi:hypothetical protein
MEDNMNRQFSSSVIVRGTDSTGTVNLAAELVRYSMDSFIHR